MELKERDTVLFKLDDCLYKRFNCLPAAVVRADSVKSFQGQLQDAAKQLAVKSDNGWKRCLSPRAPLPRRGGGRRLFAEEGLLRRVQGLPLLALAAQRLAHVLQRRVEQVAYPWDSYA